MFISYIFIHLGMIRGAGSSGNYLNDRNTNPFNKSNNLFAT